RADTARARATADHRAGDRPLGGGGTIEERGRLRLVRAADDHPAERPGAGAGAARASSRLGAGGRDGAALSQHLAGAVRDGAGGTAVARVAAGGTRAAGTGPGAAPRPGRDARRRAALDRAAGDGAGGARLRRAGSAERAARPADAP